MVKEHNNALNLSYKGILRASNWLNLTFGANIQSERSKTHIGDLWSNINSFMPYQSMYNADGTLARMEADTWARKLSKIQNTVSKMPATILWKR